MNKHLGRARVRASVRKVNRSESQSLDFTRRERRSTGSHKLVTGHGATYTWKEGLHDLIMNAFDAQIPQLKYSENSGVFYSIPPMHLKSAEIITQYNDIKGKVDTCAKLLVFSFLERCR